MASNTPEMLRLIDSISRDRNVEKETLFTDIEQALVSAARKHFNALETDEFTAELDRLTGVIRVFREQEEIPLDELGRIPAQTAKQVMIQRFREDERASIYEEFSQRVGELVTGMAQRYEGGALVVQVGRAEGFMPRSEQIPGEQHQPGERVRCLILDVRDAGSQVKIVLSRAHEDFIRRMFEVEVPEVAERIIEVKAMAREPGHRTKLAVSSIDSKVDAVGACVGVRGSRIKNIVDELGGEKIDIVRWNESSQILIQNSLKPAEVIETSLCFQLSRATVVVAEDQLSLAIGKRGQNVRLAARLTKWDVDILTPVEFTKSLDAMQETLKLVPNVTEESIDRLAALGVISVFDVEEVGAPYLLETLEVDEETAQTMIASSVERGKQITIDQAREKEEAERRKQEEAAAAVSQPGETQAADILGQAMAPISSKPEEEKAAATQTAEPTDASAPQADTPDPQIDASQPVTDDDSGETAGDAPEVEAQTPNAEAQTPEAELAAEPPEPVEPTESSQSEQAPAGHTQDTEPQEDLAEASTAAMDEKPQ
jgi:N utilization substance protein A